MAIGLERGAKGCMATAVAIAGQEAYMAGAASDVAV